MAVKHDPGYIDAVEQLQATQIKRLMVNENSSYKLLKSSAKVPVL